MAPASIFSSNHSPAIGMPAHAPVQPSNGNGNQAHDAASLWARIEQVTRNDEEKRDLLAEIMTRYEFLSQEYQRVAIQQADVVECQQVKQSMASLKNLLERNPFVLVLIDGDGMIFKNEFIRGGLEGGRRAANELYNEVMRYIERETTTIPLTSRVLCRVYANVKGLADVLVRAEVIEETSQFEDFVRGFTNGKISFDFTDVGSGKDRADEKIIDALKLFIEDFHCRQIFFGCSHDNGFARPLEEYMMVSQFVSKVTLLEGVPFEKELLTLPYKTKKFPSLFRDAKLNVVGAPTFGIPHREEIVPGRASPLVKNYNMINGLPARLPPPLAAADLPRTPSSSTLASDGIPVVVNRTMNWAAKAAAPPPPTTTKSPQYKPANREEVIARNRAGQRVDPPCRDYDKSEVDRIKKIKMCNVHFLRGECPFGEACTHLHLYKPTEAEIATLRLVARMAPCQNGSGCQDIKCIYGHRCPAPSSKTIKVKGTKSCIFGENCKFPESLHDIDCNVVKTLVVR